MSESSNPYSGSSLRKSIWTFFSGKVLSAILTITILLLLVRILPVAQYAGYVSLVAMMELGCAVSQLGLSWVSARYLPEYRLKASGKTTSRFCIKLLLLQVASITFFSGIFLLLLPIYLQWVGLAQFKLAALLFIGLFWFEGAARFIRDGLLGPLMLQGELRLSMIGRQALLLAGILTFQSGSDFGLQQVVAIELFAAAVGCVLAAIGLWRFLYRNSSNEGEAGWVSGPGHQQVRVAMQMYAAHMLTLLYSPQIIVNLMQRLAGPEATALFGFVKSLVEQLSRYLPATLLFGIVRPKLVASYVEHNDVSLLGQWANFAGKLSILLLLLVLAITSMMGEQLLYWVSGAKFTDTGWVLFAYLLVLVPYSQRQLLETVAVTLDKAHVCNWGSAAGVLVLPCLWYLLQQGAGVWAGVISLGLGYVIFNLIVIVSLNAMTAYRTDWMSASKLMLVFALSVSLSIVASEWISGLIEIPVMLLLANALFAGVVYVLVFRLIMPLTAFDKTTFNSVLKRQVFKI